MAVKIRFYDATETIECTFLECAAMGNKIGIRIEDTLDSIPIILDKPTAIRLSRELRKQIALLD